MAFTPEYRQPTQPNKTTDLLHPGSVFSRDTDSLRFYPINPDNVNAVRTVLNIFCSYLAEDPGHNVNMLNLALPRAIMVGDTTQMVAVEKRNKQQEDVLFTLAQETVRAARKEPHIKIVKVTSHRSDEDITTGPDEHNILVLIADNKGNYFVPRKRNNLLASFSEKNQSRMNQEPPFDKPFIFQPNVRYFAMHRFGHISQMDIKTAEKLNVGLQPLSEALEQTINESKFDAFEAAILFGALVKSKPTYAPKENKKPNGIPHNLSGHVPLTQAEVVGNSRWFDVINDRIIVPSKEVDVMPVTFKADHIDEDDVFLTVNLEVAAAADEPNTFEMAPIAGSIPKGETVSRGALREMNEESERSANITDCYPMGSMTVSSHLSLPIETVMVFNPTKLSNNVPELTNHQDEQHPVGKATLSLKILLSMIANNDIVDNRLVALIAKSVVTLKQLNILPPKYVQDLFGEMDQDKYRDQYAVNRTKYNIV